MKLALVDSEEGHTTVVNTEQITYLRQDVYGTAIHFASGEHIICALDIDTVLGKLDAPQSAESILIQSVR